MVTLKIKGASYQLPVDIATAWQTLNMMSADLDDLTAEGWRDVRVQFREELASGITPNWNEWRDSINEVCIDGGYPTLCETEASALPNLNY